MTAVDFSILDRHREVVARIEREQAQKQQREQDAAREKAIEAATLDEIRLQAVFGLPIDPEQARRNAEQIIKE